MVAMLICHISRVNDGAKVAGYICGIVVVAHGTHPWSYAVLRLTETVLGIAVADKLRSQGNSDRRNGLHWRTS
ncbi:MAG: hypothetical protein DMG36_13925 [Acidobacteria bacterium]|nr:MAG: hypothetical protein DMG36_13925 [Acidobacteriota bacterium]